MSDSFSLAAFEKRCSSCKELKELKWFSFASRSKDGLNCQCRACVSVANKVYRSRNISKYKERSRLYSEKNKESISRRCKEWLTKNKDHVASYRKEYYNKNKEKIRLASKDTHLRNRYRITEEEYNIMLRNQDGRCAVCLEYPSGNGNHNNLHVDHSHATGEVRSLLCHGCNAALGYIRENKTTALRLAEYIVSFEEQSNRSANE